METSNNSIVVEIGEIENTCFVVMPFDSLFQIQYERVIRPAVEELGLKCVRGDELYSKPQVMSDIWRSIRTSRLIIAELTGKNPNVFYEIGLAHAIGKPIILLTRNENDVPFDLKSLRYRYYNVDDPYWGFNLSGAIKSMIQNILSESDFSTTLDGIRADLVTIPSPPRRLNINPPENVSQTDISGSWKVKFKITDGFAHEGVIYITQNNEALNATMTVTYESGEMTSVVQEVLTGAIKGAEVALDGVSYTFIQQGQSDFYGLDSFRLKLSGDHKKMSGTFIDDKSDRGRATFIKDNGSK